MSSARAAAVARMFYPGDALALAVELEDLFGDVPDCEPRLGIRKASVVRHAGYVVSAFSTPLGHIPLDRQAREAVHDLPQIVVPLATATA